MRWPAVLDEDATLDVVLSGASLARFGDGEFNLCLGRPCITQPWSAEIGQRLRRLLAGDSDCLVGIPRMGQGPKAKFWARYAVHPELQFSDRVYGSAFITRPDSAPWIDRADYWEKIRRIWAGRHVALVRGSGKSLISSMLEEAASVREVIAPPKNAFASYGELMESVGTPELAILCIGPTATVMASDLASRGVQAVDLGHLGMFLRKHERGEPMVVTEKDRAWDRNA